ncbi:MAG: 50S ribosome-binding GTPase [Bifidobacteriaceae bacterium]|nr:50S ribosome-binding GTPase [Bifidobacteriaceae bacterium]
MTPAGERGPAALQEARRALAELTAVARTVRGRLGDQAVVAQEAACRRLRRRLDLGLDHTVVALIGGTGSGKSSLFNRIGEMTFSEVGVLRPTTADAVAFVWGGDAGPFLDWLGVARDNWIRRDSVLDGDVAAMRGLILLDLPDYDSASGEHREVVDRVLPLADLLVWVTDPQKYADPSLHRDYSGVLAQRVGNLAVVLNQVDTLAPDDVPAVLQDLSRLLKRAGSDVPNVVVTSALTGDGVDSLRQLLVAARTEEATPAERARVLLGREATRLREEIGPPDGLDRSWIEPARRAARDQLLALVEAAPEPDEPNPAPQIPSVEQIHGVLLGWLERALVAVPAPWGAAVGRSLASGVNIRARLDEAVTAALAGSVADAAQPAAAPLSRRGRRARRRAEPEAAAASAAGSRHAALERAVSAVVERTMTFPTNAVLDDWVAVTGKLLALAAGSRGQAGAAA